MTDGELVRTGADRRSVDVGRPFVWVHQDQSGYDTPLPTHLGLSSPWENPTSVSLDVFLVDVLVVFLAVGGCVLVTAAFMTTLGRRRGAVRRSA
jgi:hypothetical protein